uniref:hypothetical protein n=1 Tax=Prevotella sp. TaxID=59823 RepID=UPI0040292173
MIYIKSFKNYDEFKQLFGVVKHGNGVVSRKNKILLACLKDRKLFHWWLGFKEWCDRTGKKYLYENHDYLRATNMDDLKTFAKYMVSSFVYNDPDNEDTLYLLGFDDNFLYILYSTTLSLDSLNGICTDGDSKSIRYENIERGRIFKMKAGKFITRCIEECRIPREYMPEQLKRWIGEEFARDWQVYAEQRISNDYTLHVDDDFEAIYDSDRCLGDFGSCMTDKGHHTFYRDAIKAKAAYITDEDDMIVARCIVYTDVWDENNNHYRLAERQYSSGQDDVLKQILVDKLIKAGEIDGYKRVGASCRDNKNFVRNNGESMRDLKLHIDCCLEHGDVLSFQDSFVYYDYNDNTSCNNSSAHYDYELDSTEEYFELEGNYSDWNECIIPEGDSVYDDYYEDWMYSGQSEDAIYHGRRIQINRSHASGDYCWNWSDYEDAYLFDDECCYVEKEEEYRLLDDCVEDIDGEYQLESDCKWSDYHDGYIHEDNAVWSSIADSWLDSEKDSQCAECGEWYPGNYDGECYSDITGEDYCSEECADKAEAWLVS